MTQAERLAALHATAFSGPERWTAPAFEAALADPACFFAFDHGGSDSFALGRIAADEAELLTLIVSDDRRGQGLGRTLLNQFEHLARIRGARAAFLEVAAENTAARSLYRSNKWDEVGHRKAYYGAEDAVVMRKVL